MFVAIRTADGTLTGPRYAVSGGHELAIGEEEFDAGDYVFIHPLRAYKVVNGVIEFQTNLRKIPHYIRISSDASDTDQDRIDDVSIASYATLTLQKRDSNGDALTGVKHNDKIFLRPTKGKITNEANVNIYSTNLVNGALTIRWHGGDSMGVGKLEVYVRRKIVRVTTYELVFR